MVPLSSVRSTLVQAYDEDDSDWSERLERLALSPDSTPNGVEALDPDSERDDERRTAFIAFTRVLSGTLRKGTTCYALGPKHDPAAAVS